MKNLEITQALEELPKILNNDWIKQAMAKLDKINMTPEERMKYERMMARKGSLLEMREEEDRKLKKENAIETAKKLKKLKMAIKEIAFATGLTELEVEKL